MLHQTILASFANDNDPLIPELWARESIAVLEENMVMGMLVHRDFSMDVANFGDVVNTRKPADMKVSRKTDSDTIDYNDAVVTNVQVPLNQHFYAAFVIKDGERSKSIQDLIAVHLVPAMKAMGNGVDRAILGRMAHTLIRTPQLRVGRLLNLTSSNAKDTILEAREQLNRTLATTTGRRLVLAPGSETSLLQTELFISAEQRGDSGTALTEALLGRILGFDTFMDQNVNGIHYSAAAREVQLGATTAAIAAGTSGSLTAFDITGYVAVAGSFANLAGNDQPTWLTAVVDNATDTTAATLNEETKYAVGNGAVITVYVPADVDGNYSVGYTKYITIDGFAADKPPVVGQLLAFGASPGTRHTYTIIETKTLTSTSCQVLLDRPLEVAVNNNDLAFPGPAGDFNVAFHRNAFALVSRPLARPDASMGARSFVASHNDIAMRATMQYDIDAGGTKVVLDLLAGTALLDNSLAALVLG